MDTVNFDKQERILDNLTEHNSSTMFTAQSRSHLPTMTQNSNMLLQPVVS